MIPWNKGKETGIKVLIGQRFNKWLVISQAPRRGRYVYWNCLCDCGREVVVSGENIKKGLSKQCLSCAGKRIPTGDAAFHRVLSEYKLGAKRRNYLWELTDEKAKILFQSDCHYCGKKSTDEPICYRTCGKFTKGFFYNGIDRLNNKLGYITGNVVPCCMICNHGKHSLPIEIFIKWIERIKNK